MARKKQDDSSDYDETLGRYVSPTNEADLIHLARIRAQDFLNDPAYTNLFIVRLLAGKVPPELEAFIWEIEDNNVLQHPDYVASVETRMNTATMHPVVELAIWYTAYGRPETHGDSPRNRTDARRYMGFLRDDLEQRRKAKQKQAATTDAPTEG